MISATIAACLALAPAAVLGASVSARQDVPFDYDSLSLREVGARNTLDWRIWLEKDGDPISFWHDVPLYPDPETPNIINMYVEIPRWNDAKIETKRNEPLNPIFHDDSDDLPRFVATFWPHKTYPFNYGSLPQTWEDSTVEHNFTGYVGDNDPMDVFDISALKPAYVGQVKQVKILGGLAMIDDETTDWKVIVIDVEDPLAPLVNNLEDLEQYRPGLSESYHDWFIYYKVLRSGQLNTIVGNKYQTADDMTHHIEESHEFWKGLVRNTTKVEKIDIWQTSNPRLCKSYVKSEDATERFEIPPEASIAPAAERPEKYDKWYYVDADFQPLPGQEIDVE